MPLVLLVLLPRLWEERLWTCLNPVGQRANAPPPPPNFGPGAPSAHETLREASSEAPVLVWFVPTKVGRLLQVIKGSCVSPISSSRAAVLKGEMVDLMFGVASVVGVRLDCPLGCPPGCPFNARCCVPSTVSSSSISAFAAAFTVEPGPSLPFPLTILGLLLLLLLSLSLSELWSSSCGGRKRCEDVV